MLPILLFAAALGPNDVPGPGVPEPLAKDRANTIRELRYTLSFRIPEAKSEPIPATAAIRFQLAAPHAVTLDFEQPRAKIRAIHAAGKPVEFGFENGHILIPASATRAGENTIDIDFTAGNESLNRNDEFLYTLFVPARARLAFPCFDQPDLKARYTLTLNTPAAWQAVANGAETKSRTEGTRRITEFAETPPLPTYLFAFAAGKFKVEIAERAGRTFRMFHRETDDAKVARNRDQIFDLHARALAWLEDYTAIPYPWGKFDFVLIPSFQFGGMEHAGAILYNASGLLLDPSATQAQMLGRASVIAHETAHMWFGDLVTMRWFNDVWMKEVMANFMAAKIVNPSFPDLNHELRFLLAHYPAAYEVDRTAGANPIRQDLANLNEAGSLYGAIIYQKAPIVMRQLEALTGEQAFRDALRVYLKQYSFGNATWLDLVRIFDGKTGGRISPWSRAWVEQRGRPEGRTTLTVDSQGRIAMLAITQSDPLKRGVLWPQKIKVALGYADRIESIDAGLSGATTDIAPARGKPAPLYVLANGGGIAYGLFLLDDRSKAWLLGHLEEVPDALTRGSAWVTLWENMLAGAVTPAQYLDLAARALPRETDEQNAQRALSDLTTAFWRFLPAASRLERAPALEAMLRAGITRASTASAKSAWFTAFRSTTLSPQGTAWIERLWRREEKIPGLTFSEPDDIDMALSLAVRDVPNAQEILAQQRDRTQNPDRRARFEFVMPALSADPNVRDQAFERVRDPSNRTHEPWVLESMRFLNHPLRESTSGKYVKPSLDLLSEIQRTGDIFFPKRWMDAALSGHRSPESAATVRSFLAASPTLPERLRWVVLTAADELFRASSMSK